MSATGMILWQQCSAGLPDHAEVPDHAELLDVATHSSFAVVLDDDHDRLISWAQLQNLLFRKPTEVALPCPDLFSRISVQLGDSASGWALDVSDMFHNMLLPPWLAKCFPLTKPRFKNLPGPCQRQIIRQLGLTRRPQQSALFRPSQQTMPMGFTWEIYAAYTVVQVLLQYSAAILRPLASMPLACCASTSPRASRNRVAATSCTCTSSMTSML